MNHLKSDLHSAINHIKLGVTTTKLTAVLLFTLCAKLTVTHIFNVNKSARILSIEIQLARHGVTRYRRYLAVDYHCVGLCFHLLWK